MKDIYTISEFADEIGVTVQTLRNWDKNGKLKPYQLTKGGNRLYSYKQILQLRKESSDKTGKSAIYLIDKPDTEEIIKRMKINLEINNEEYSKYIDKLNEEKEFNRLIKAIGIGAYDRLLINKDNIDMDIKTIKLLKVTTEALGCELVII